MAITQEQINQKLQGLFGGTEAECATLNETVVSVPVAAVTTTTAVTYYLMAPDVSYDVVSATFVCATSEAADSSNYAALALKSKTAAGADGNTALATITNTVAGGSLAQFVGKNATMSTSNTRVEAGGLLYATVTAATTEASALWGAGVLSARVRRVS